MSFDLRPAEKPATALKRADAEAELAESQERRLSPVAERVIQRVDALLPKKHPEFSPGALMVVNDLRDSVQKLDYDMMQLSFVVEIALVSAPLLTQKDAGKRLFDRDEDRYSIDVAVNPLELTVLLKGLLYLARAIEAQQNAVDDIFRSNSYVRQMGEGTATYRLLSVMDQLHLLDHPEYKTLAEVLRRRVLVKFRYPDYQAIKSRMKGRLIDNEEFWEEGFRQVQDIEFPNADALNYQRRTIQTEERKVRKLTAVSTLRKGALSRAGILPQSEQEIAQEYRQKGERKRQIQAAINRMIFAETRDWREALKPFIQRISRAYDDDDFLYEALLTLSNHFDQGQGPDRDLSLKARTTYQNLREASQHSEHTEYEKPLRAYIRQALTDREPLIMWLTAFRNDTSTFLLNRAIQNDPRRFIDLEKLLIHQLSKAGLMRQKGEQDLYLRRPSSIEDTQLLASLPKLFHKLQFMAEHYTRSEYIYRSKGLVMAEATDRTRVEMASAQTNPILSLLSEEHLIELTRETAYARVESKANDWRASYDRALIKLELRLQGYRDLLSTNWWNEMSFADFVNQLKFGILERQRRREATKSKEKEDQERFSIATIFYSSEKFAQYDDLPFIPLNYDDQLIKNFLFNADGQDVSKYSEKTYPPRSLNEALGEFRDKLKRAKTGIVYLAKTVNGRLPIFSGYVYISAARLNTGADEWLVYVQKKDLDSYGPGVTASGASASAYDVYSGEQRLNVEKARSYLETLSTNQDLYMIYRDFITELSETNLNQTEKFRDVVVKHLVILRRYIRDKRFYDIRPEPFDTNVDALQYIAANPEIGFKCNEAARVAKAFVESVGLKASVLVGESPYLSHELAICSDATPHAICTVIFPSGSPIDVDLTPPVTAKTPMEVQLKFTKYEYGGGHRIDYMEGMTGFSRKKLMKRVAMVFLAGTVLMGAKAAVFPNTGLFELPIVHFGPEQPTVGDSSDTAIDGSPEDAPPVDEDERDTLNIDFTQLPWKEVGAGLLAVLAGSASFMYAFHKIEERRRDREWRKLRQSTIDKTFPLDERIPIVAGAHKVAAEVSARDSQAEMLRVIKKVKKFDWEAARPMLEYVAVVLNEKESVNSELIAELLARKQYAEAYDLLAYYSLQDKTTTLGALHLRAFRRSKSSYSTLQQRGMAIKGNVEGIDAERPPLDLNSADFKLFVRGMEMIQIMQEFKQAVLFQASLYKMHQTLAKPDIANGDELLRARAEQNAWRLRRQVLDTIQKIERNLSEGAVKLITTEELEQLRQEFPKELSETS